MEGVLRPGAVLLGKYRVESVLGRGGMGVVLRVTHLQLGEELAVKVLLPEGAISPEVTARFLREAQAVVRLRGEHVAKVSDIGVLPEGLPFIVMEYLRGIDLAGELKRRNLLVPGEAVDYVLQACEALAEAHAHGIVHRDIKPANLFLTTRPDGTPLVKVLDFGISKAPITASGLVTRTDTVMGTAGYMSPEQMKATRDVDARTDIWALGIVLYESLTGRRPFEGESLLAIVLKASTETPPPMDPRIPRGLQSAVLRCLEKDRRARFPSIAELAAALAPFARDQRAASIVVERAKLMHHRPGSAAEPPPPGHGPSATTLSGSAGAIRSRASRRRYMIAGAFTLLGVTALVAVGGVIAGAWRSRAVEISVTETHDGGPPRAPGATTPLRSGDDATVPVLPDAESIDAAAPIVNPDAAAPISSATCFADVSSQPAGAEIVIDDNNVIGTTPQKVELPCGRPIDLVIRKARLAPAPRTITPTREGVTVTVVLVKQTVAVKISSTPAGATIKMNDKSFGVTPTTVKLPAFESSTLVLSKDGYATATEVVAPKANGVAVHTVLKKLPPRPPQPDTVAGRPPVGSASPAGAGTGEVPAPSSKPACATTNVDDMIQQAANQYGAGFSKFALSLMSKALGCKQDIRMYRLAAMYACGAHDLPAAKLYFAKLPVSAQTAIEQKCQQEGLQIRGP